MNLSLLIILVFACTFCKAAKHDSCKKPSMTWNAGNAKKMILNVTSFEDCANHFNYGEDGLTCKYFTWNDENHPYFGSTCILFQEIGRKEECENCFSAAASCFCGSPVACKYTGNNLLSAHTESRAGWAERLCNFNSGCSNYTCFTSDHKYNQICLLYSECPEVDDTCSGCCSGVKTLDPCVGYKELNSPTRNVLSVYTEGYQDTYLGFEEKYDHVKILPDWKGSGWYRFTGEAGNKMAESFPGFKKCGAEEPSFLLVNKKNQPPAKGMGKSMKVCKSNDYYRKECEDYKEGISMMNCGDFFVYKLNLISHVHCGVFEEEEETEK